MMVAAWVRRDFGGAGVTQYRPGRHLPQVAAHFLGRALLCIDVSGSMCGEPLQAAVAGGLDFLDEAEQAGYRCGLVLWHHGVDAYLPTTSDPGEIGRALRSARSSGGNDLCPTLDRAIGELGPMGGDRVVCVFGDGDVGDETRTAAKAAQARALGIRFVVRGLGAGASGCLVRTLTPDEPVEAARTVEAGSVRQGIASMAASLRVR